MSYTPTEWKNGDVITAEKMNKIQGAIENYTPTEWKNGDIITAEKMNKIQQAIENLSTDGGGSELPSGLKIAHVTIVTKEPPADWGPQGPRRDDYLSSGFDLQSTELQYGGSMVGRNAMVNLSASGFYQVGVTSESSPKEILVIYFGDFTDLIIQTGNTTIGGSSFEDVDLNGDVTLTEDEYNHYVRISGDCTISAYPTYWTP